MYHDSVGAGDHLNTAQLFNLAYRLPRRATVYGEAHFGLNAATPDVQAYVGLSRKF